jgi:type IV pilus assembly protein PilQ
MAGFTRAIFGGLAVLVLTQGIVAGAAWADPSERAGLTRDAEGLISIDLQGADIHTVLRSLSEASGRNIVANSNVTGSVRLKLTDVAWQIALDVVLKTQGLGSVEEGEIIRVAPLKELRQEEIDRQTAVRKQEDLVPLVTEVVPIEFANASELSGTMEGRLTQRGNIVVDERTNSLIITDVPTNIPIIADLIHELDGPAPQVEIIAKLVDIDVAAIEELGVNWDLKNLHSTNQAISGNVGSVAGLTDPVGTANVGIIRSGGTLDLAIQALASENRANIISNPKITTLNNREARILVGKEIPLVVRDEAGNAITELKKIGIELRVAPHINQGDLITLDLKPTVSDLASQASTQGGVIINTTEADTRVQVQNGETAIIGGLIRTNETEFERGIPLLKDIPLLGALFRSSSRAESQRELVIFVTPRIIR